MSFERKTKAPHPQSRHLWRDFFVNRIYAGITELTNKDTKPLKSLAIRLTLWYVGITTLSFLVLQIASYLVLRANLANRVDQALQDEVAEDIPMAATKGVDFVAEDFKREADSVGNEKEFFRILDASGRIVATSDLTKWPDLPVDRRALDEAIAGNATLLNLSQTKGHPFARVIYAKLTADTVLQVGYSRTSDERLLENYRETYGLAVVAILACSVLVGWVMAKRVLAGVENVTQTAARITNGDLSSRASLTGRGDEIDELAKTFNLMIERIQTLITSMRDITDDIAHDLRSPIMRVRGAAELALTHGPTSDQEPMVGSIIEECDNLLNLINTMLEISETEAGVAQLYREEFDLGAVVHDMCELFVPASEDKGVALSCQADRPLLIRGDRDKIRRAVGHILDNAMKYTDSGGEVSVICAENNGTITISIQDTGIGIAADHHTAIFSRFYRADRSRSQPGNGLGLSLSNAIVKAHRGVITVKSALGEGSTFTIRLPRATG